MKDKAMQKAVREYYQIEERIQRLINCASYDLYFGPYESGDIDGDGFIYPGFSKAVDEISEKVELQEVWYDGFSGELMTSEPEGYTDEETGEFIEPMWEEIYHLERGDVATILFGKELASYIK